MLYQSRSLEACWTHLHVLGPAEMSRPSLPLAKSLEQQRHHQIALSAAAGVRLLQALHHCEHHWAAAEPRLLLRQSLDAAAGPALLQSLCQPPEHGTAAETMLLSK